MKKNRWMSALWAAAWLAAAPALLAGGDFLSGKVHYLDQETGGLSMKWDSAVRKARESGEGDLFLTGHVFLSRHTVHMGDRREMSTDYRVKVSSERIRIQRSTWNKSGFSFNTDCEEEGPAVVLLLHRLTRSGSQVLDAHMIDLDDSYTFEEQPLYWMGEAENPESLARLIEVFDSGGERLQDRLLFVIGSHVDREAGEFLHRTALGDYPFKVRKSAIFWIGNLNDESCLEFLKDIYNRENSGKLREQVVFALHISKHPQAPREMVRIARTAESSKVRKSAVFWLGQKASEESVGFLKEVVDSDKDDELKEAAVFAISQLPENKSVPMLIDIARTHRSATIRKKAIFWLGQSGSEDALDFFEEILLGKKR